MKFNELKLGEYYKITYDLDTHNCPWRIGCPTDHYVRLVNIRDGLTSSYDRKKKDYVYANFKEYKMLGYTYVSPTCGLIAGTKGVTPLMAFDGETEIIGMTTGNGTITDIVPSTKDEFLENKHECLWRFAEEVQQAADKMWAKEDGINKLA